MVPVLFLLCRTVAGFSFHLGIFFGKDPATGGLAYWLAGCLLQFYHLPLGGALISIGLFLIIGVFMQRICQQTASSIFCYLLALLPILALFPLHIDMNYRLQGTVAYCCMLGVFLFYTISDMQILSLSTRFDDGIV